MESRNPPIPKSQPTNTFKPQTKKATQNANSLGGKSQLSTGQKSQLKKFTAMQKAIFGKIHGFQHTGEKV
jgi:hypothetical protein